MNFTALSQGRQRSDKLKGGRLREGVSFPKAAGLEVTESQENLGLLPGLIKVQLPARPSPRFTPGLPSRGDPSVAPGHILNFTQCHQV